MEIIEKYTFKMQEVIENFSNELSQIHVGKINASILKNIKIDYYNVLTDINQVSKIINNNSKTLEIEPWDINTLKLIEKAIQKSDLGINPQNNGKTIRLVFPELTKEKRLSILKNIKKIAENFKINIRNLRRDANSEIKKLKNDITNDEIKSTEEKIQNITNKFINQIDNCIKSKENEILEI